MTNGELEKKINKAFSDAVPEVYDRIIHEIDMKRGRLPEVVRSRHYLPADKRDQNDAGTHVYDSAPDQNNTGTGAQETVVTGVTAVPKKGRRRFVRGLMVAAAAAAVALGTVFGMSAYNTANAVASTVSLDVNPSIEIKLNKDKRVLEVIPRSDDAVNVIGNMDMKGTELGVAVNALLGSLISKGYISELANSILVSVDNADTETAASLQTMLMEEINAVIGNDNINGAVIGQVITGDEDLADKAGKYGITLSKAQLIKQITTQNPTLKFEKLASLPINDLNLLKRDGIENISCIGNASEAGYIGNEKAVEIALEYTGLDRDEISFLRVDMDYENDKLCYAVTFHKPDGDLDFDYNFDIEASTGDIISKEMELENPGAAVAHDSAKSYLNPEEAKLIALSLAGKDEGSIYEYEIELDYKRVDHYDIEFKADGKEYNYTICMYGGRIIKDKWEIEEDVIPFEGNPEVTSEYEKKLFIGDDIAKKIALKKAGVSLDEAYDIEVEMERDSGRLLYEVEFKSGIYGYSFDLDPLTGDVVDYEIDFNA